MVSRSRLFLRNLAVSFFRCMFAVLMWRNGRRYTEEFIGGKYNERARRGLTTRKRKLMQVRILSSTPFLPFGKVFVYVNPVLPKAPDFFVYLYCYTVAFENKPY